MANEKRLISIDEALEATHREPFWTKSEAAYIRSFLVKLPKADAVEVVHGWWEKCEPDKHGNRKPKCSVCGKYHLAWWSDYTHCNYCPNCGAKMDGDVNGI